MTQSSKANTVYRCYLGLGSNLSNELGTPTEHIQQAIASLEAHSDISYLRASSLYASKPMGPQDQPDFVNAVVEIDTFLSPLALLALCQQLEQDAQRVRLRKWGERSLDVDILIYADEKISLPTLTVPHIGIADRNFVLVPLLETNPDLMIDNKSIATLIKSSDLKGLYKLDI